MTGTTVAKKELREVLFAKADDYAAALPEGYTANRLITGALVAYQLNPDLQKCTPASIAVALARVAQWGLDVGDTAHLVPFGSTCTAVPGYTGLIQLMCLAGAKKVEAFEVYEGDRFEWELGTNAHIKHQPVAGPPGRKITHAYAIATLGRGVVQFEVMTADELEAIRQKYSKQWKSGPLTYWWARKAVIRRLAKYVVRSASPAVQSRLQAALAQDVDAEPLPGIRPANVTEDGEIRDVEFEVGDAAEDSAA